VPEERRRLGALTYLRLGAKKRINREIREIGERRREDWKIRKRWKGREGGERGWREWRSSL
jgi:hypothetical protein